MNATYYTASWCQPCKTFKPIAFAVMAEEGLKFNEVDIQDIPDGDLEALALMSVPTVIFWDEAQLEESRVSGAFPEPQFRNRVIAYKGRMAQVLG